MSNKELFQQILYKLNHCDDGCSYEEDLSDALFAIKQELNNDYEKMFGEPYSDNN